MQLMKKHKQKLTLDRVQNYQIKVPGHLDQRWLDWTEKMIVIVETNDDGIPITTLTGTVDQAALQGLLRQLYSLGLPLISVFCLDYDSEELTYTRTN